MIIEACQCDDGLGLAHDHVTEQFVYEGHLKTRFTDRVRIWVDWKKVARLLLIDGSIAPSGDTSL